MPSPTSSLVTPIALTSLFWFTGEITTEIKSRGWQKSRVPKVTAALINQENYTAKPKLIYEPISAIKHIFQTRSARLRRSLVNGNYQLLYNLYVILTVNSQARTLGFYRAGEVLWSWGITFTFLQLNSDKPRARVTILDLRGLTFYNTVKPLKTDIP